MIELSIIIFGGLMYLGLIQSAKIFVKCIRDIDKTDTARHATMCCLTELVDKLNETFPGSNLKVEDNIDVVKVIGELKFLKK